MTRADRVAARLGEREVDALLVNEAMDLRWLTGFTGSNGLALVGDDLRAFVTDFRYVEQAAAQVDGFSQARAQRDLLDGVEDLLPPDDLRLGYDDAHTTVRQHGRLRDILPERVELVACGGVVSDLRMVKEPAEVERIRAAAALADEALRWALERGLVGRTEREVALEMEHEMRRLGAQDPSFPSIVAAAEHSARPHAEPRDVEIPAGTLVTIDMGARLDGYCSDCTRTVATGPVEDEMREVYELVLRAQLAGLEAVAPGRTGREVDSIARAVVEEAGHGERFGHGLGHGVGLDVHEGPTLSQRQGDATLEPGHVVTVEPGVYLPGRFGVRIEDLVVVADGGPEILTGIPKELTEVG